MADHEVEVPSGPVSVAGTLSVPEGVRGTIVFAHGSGSGRFSPRNRAVASVLLQSGFATLMMDLLTAEEEEREVRGQSRLRAPDVPGGRAGVHGLELPRSVRGHLTEHSAI